MMKLFPKIENRPSHLEQSYIAQRTGMAFLAAAFPFVFLASSFLLGRTEFQTSISAYYWTGEFERNFFVGVLCAVAVFLVLYKGHNWAEDRILDGAGLAAVGIAFSPMQQGSDCTSSELSAHGVFAVTFFFCIAFVCIYMSRESLKDIADPNKRERFRLAYRVCSIFMAGSVIFAAVSRLLPDNVALWLCKQGAIFWVEAVGIWAFSAYWYIKTRELDPARSWVPFRKRQ